MLAQIIARLKYLCMINEPSECAHARMPLDHSIQFNRTCFYSFCLHIEFRIGWIVVFFIQVLLELPNTLKTDKKLICKNNKRVE